MPKSLRRSDFEAAHPHTQPTNTSVCAEGYSTVAWLQH